MRLTLEGLGNVKTDANVDWPTSREVQDGIARYSYRWPHAPADAAASPRVPPLAKALAELFAYKQAGNGPAGTGPSISDRLDDFFKPSASGGPTAKGLMGALLTGGLMDVVAQFRGAGKGSVVDSWVGSGANTPVSPTDLSSTLSEDQIAFLMKRTGMSREELLAGLSDRLPKVVDALTPEGRMPTADEVTKRI